MGTQPLKGDIGVLQGYAGFRALGSPKNEDAFLGVPIMTGIIFGGPLWGLNWGPLIRETTMCGITGLGA